MMSAKLIDIIVILAAITILLGVPILLLLTYRFHRAQTRALAPFIFTDAEELVKSVQNSYGRIKTQLEQQLTLRKKTQDDILEGIDFRLRELQKAHLAYEQIQATIQKHSKKVLADPSDLYYRINRMLIRRNIRLCDQVKDQIDKLIYLEQDLRNTIKSMEARRNAK
jgi:hypothetical protein